MSYLEEVTFKDNVRPHTVILGAGASRACLPEGDLNNKKLPVMNDLVEVIGLEKLLENFSIKSESKNFEDIYSDIFASGQEDLLRELQSMVRGYFSDMVLPFKPTLYDYLICSLRGKDYIASFNWDPLLLQAYLRCPFEVSEKPRLIFLHGNVMVGMAKEEKVCGLLMNRTTSKGSILKPVDLLYPTKQKNYSEDPFIKGQWYEFKRALSNSFYTTIFGYSAPKTDVEAREAMLNAWSDNEVKELSQFEIIDINESALDSWDEFIVEHHYDFKTNLDESALLSYPRRTSEYLWAWSQELKWLTPERMPFFDYLEDLYQWFEPCLKEERLKRALK